jgi:phosphohistidine phosphatase
MRIYFLRHGIAEDARPGQADSDRQLTAEGVEEMKAEAQALKRLNLKLDLILTSPYARARKTAEIVAKALDMEDRLRVEPRLAAGFDFDDLQEIGAAYSEAGTIMLVGHNPGLPMTAGRLVGGIQIDMKKGGLIRVEADRIEPGRGVLQWLLTPGVLIR